MRIAVCQINPTVGDIEGNAQRVAEFAQAAADMRADVIVTPEQVITGYPAEDLLYRQDFIRRAEEATADHRTGRAAGARGRAGT